MLTGNLLKTDWGSTVHTCMYGHLWVYVHMNADKCGGQRLILGVFFNGSPHLWRECLSIKLRAVKYKLLLVH